MVLVYLSQTTTTDNYYSRSSAFILLNNFVLDFRYPPMGNCLPNDKNIGSDCAFHSLLLPVIKSLIRASQRAEKTLRGHR